MNAALNVKPLNEEGKRALAKKLILEVIQEAKEPTVDPIEQAMREHYAQCDARNEPGDVAQTEMLKAIPGKLAQPG